jgi:hypothetical protein
MLQSGYLLKYFHLPALIKPPHLNRLPLLRHFYHYVNIMLKAVFTPKIALFSGLEYVNEGLAGIAAF